MQTAKTDKTTRNLVFRTRSDRQVFCSGSTPLDTIKEFNTTPYHPIATSGANAISNG